MNLLPVFLNLAERRAVVVGAGPVALEKIRTLLGCGARVHVVAPEVIEAVAALAAGRRITISQREFRPEDLDAAFLAVTATGSAGVNREVFRAARERRVLCNAADDIPSCDFYLGAVVGRGSLQIAVSTGGESPALAQRLRRELDAALPADLGPWLERVGELRRRVLATQEPGEERKARLHALAGRALCDSAACPSRLRAEKTVAGRVYLVGAGPGDPELLTLRAARLLAAADVILHDDLVPAAVLELAGAQAQVVNVGKRCGAHATTQEHIHSLLIEHARRGAAVVRLKSGDPMLFGRAAEELEALHAAGIAAEVVPGISAAFAAAAAVGRSLTDRRSSASVLLSTAHRAAGATARAAASPDGEPTRVVYMPGRDLAGLASRWLAEGLDPALPCLLVSRAGQPEQQVRRTRLDRLGAVEPVPAPAVLLAGWALAEPDRAAEREPLLVAAGAGG